MAPVAQRSPVLIRRSLLSGQLAQLLFNTGSLEAPAVPYRLITRKSR